MGYLTWYSISVERYPNRDIPIEQNILDKIQQDIQDVSGYDFTECYDYEMNCGEHIKWYDYADDMLCVSKSYPGILFTVYGEGEESTDIWYSYFIDGMVQHDPAQIVFTGFNPQLLKTPNNRR